MKKFIILLLVFAMTFTFCACNIKLNKKNTDTNDHTLVVVQKFDESPTGATQAKMTIEFVKGKVFSIYHEDVYDTIANAQAMYDDLMENKENIVAQIKVTLTDNIISYYEKDVSDWSETSFDEMVEMFEESEYWQILSKE